MGAAAVEDVAASVACIVGRYAFLEGEGIDSHNERACGCGVAVSGIVAEVLLYPISFSLLFSQLAFVGLIDVDKALADVLEIGVGIACACGELVGQVVEGEGYAIDEVVFLFPQAAVAVGSKHLECAEEDEGLEIVDELCAVDGAEGSQGVEIDVYQLLAVGGGNAR